MVLLDTLHLGEVVHIEQKLHLDGFSPISVLDFIVVHAPSASFNPVSKLRLFELLDPLGELANGFIFSNLGEGAGSTLVILVVVPPSLGLVGADQTSIHGRVAIKYPTAVSLHILHLLLIELLVGLSLFIQVARLADQHVRHLVHHVLLAAV